MEYLNYIKYKKLNNDYKRNILYYKRKNIIKLILK